MVAVAKILAIILLGYALKRVGLFGADNYKVLQKMVLYVTLPAAIITSFATGRHDLGLLWISLFGLVCATIPLVAMFVVSRRMPVARRAFLMLNGSGFNVGNFTLPILQTFIGPAAALPAIMFDVGDSIMMSPGNYVTTAALLPLDETARKAVVLICFAPAGIFSAIFTDKVLGNARLSGFCLTATGITGVAGIGWAGAGYAGTRRLSTMVQQAVQYFHRHFAENISVSDYAREHGVSVSWFIRDFRESVGVPPMRSTVHGMRFSVVSRMRSPNSFKRFTSRSSNLPSRVGGTLRFRHAFAPQERR